MLLQADISKSDGGSLPEGFVYLDAIIPEIQTDIRYFYRDNFVGERIEGYEKPRCIMTTNAAAAVKNVQDDLKRFGLALKIFDCYRPQRAVEHFIRWAEDLSDSRMKEKFYPAVPKENLFKEGYIASLSSHSRGSTVDLTLISIGYDAHKEIDLGSRFDFFGPESWPDYPGLAPEHRANRMLLQLVMEKHGFQSYPREWWHFTFVDEPFPDSYFDFPVR